MGVNLGKVISFSESEGYNPSPNYSGAEMGGEFGFACGITLDHANPNIVYLSHWVTGTAGSFPELERWITSDNGATWAKTVITANSAGQNVRPCVPRGYKGGDITLIWLYVRSYTNWFGPFDSDVKMYTFTDYATQASAGRRADARVDIFSVTRTGFSLLVSDPRASSLGLYDGAGRLVKDLTARVRSLDKGLHTIPLEHGSLAPGAYVARFANGTKAFTRPLVVCR